MKTGKDVILEYCNKVISNTDIEHVYHCFDVIKFVPTGYIHQLTGHCPSVFGLANYEGECANHTEPVDCEKCWKKALELEVE